MYHKSDYLPSSTSVFKAARTVVFESTFSPGEGFTPAAHSKRNNNFYIDTQRTDPNGAVFL